MPDGFYIGPLKIYFYGIIIMFGVLVAVTIATKEARRRGLDSEIVWDMVPWLLIMGIIGARLWHVFTPSKSMGVGPEYYFSHPLEILNTRQGGLGIPGGVIGGVIALIIYTRRKKLSFLTWADIIAPCLALAQAIGRWGNFFNQELYGPPSTLPWAIFIDKVHRLPGYEDFSTFHPMFLYESMWSIFNFLLLLFLGRIFQSKLKPGDIFWVYLIVYPVGRFFLEFIRLDPSMIGGFNANQITMEVVAVFGVVMLVFNRVRKNKPIDEEEIIPS
ncbi:MAG: prolipoprotein diacylglyceryl transferase [Anaerolineaceae bacterium]|nr:prolipoprotein diacylglyceryl transferase [Anaerolineaceae bacterium]